LLRFAVFAFFAFIRVSPPFAFSLLPALRFGVPHPPYMQPARQFQPYHHANAMHLVLHNLPPSPNAVTRRLAPNSLGTQVNFSTTR
jgi:hypothetical protein